MDNSKMIGNKMPCPPEYRAAKFIQNMGKVNNKIGTSKIIKNS